MLATIPVLLGNEFDVNVGLKKKRSVETFLETLDMDNLRTMIENDSDYGDEVPAQSSLIVNDKMSQSATSVLCS